MSLLVSIVTPTYKQADFLPTTIESVAAQTYQPIEYLIFDDGSPDNTPQVLDQYRERDFYIERHKNMGQTATINKGWRMAKGNILAWLNSDDSYFPDTVQIAVDYFEAYPEAAWVYGTPYPVDAHGNYYPFRDAPAPWDYDLLLKNNFVTQPTVFLRREVVEDVGYLDESLDYIMDYEFWLRIGKKYPGHLVPEIRARVSRYRTTKTVSGGIPRLEEIERTVRHYGAEDLPYTAHIEWVMAYTIETFKALTKLRLGAATRHLQANFRYPHAIPRGLAKLFLHGFVPPSMETRLRGLLMGYRSPDDIAVKRKP